MRAATTMHGPQNPKTALLRSCTAVGVAFAANVHCAALLALMLAHPPCTMQAAPAEPRGRGRKAAGNTRTAAMQQDIEQQPAHDPHSGQPSDAAMQQQGPGEAAAEQHGLDAFKRRPDIAHALASLLQRVSDPTIFLQPNQQLSATTRQAAKVGLGLCPCLHVHTHTQSHRHIHNGT